MGYEIAEGSEFAVFVYGTLLRGESNHFRLSGSRFLGEATTAAEFELVNLGGFPAMVQNGGTAIRGEVYAVSRSTLVLLDELEEHPSFYCRQNVKLADGTEVESYLLPPARARRYPRIETGSWRTRRTAAS